jgi:hypothetical protein
MLWKYGTEGDATVAGKGSGDNPAAAVAERRLT